MDQVGRRGVAKHIIVCRVDNKPGVVSRITGLFTRRGYNIESLTTGMTENSEVYHLTVTVIGTREELELLIHQLGRIVEVIDIYSSDERPCVTRELMLLRLYCAGPVREEAKKIAAVRGMIPVAENGECVIFESVGDEEHLALALSSVSHLGKCETIRSGSITTEI